MPVGHRPSRRLASPDRHQPERSLLLHARGGPGHAAAGPRLHRQRGLAGRHAIAGGAAYNAGKFGLMGLTEAATLDQRKDGVRVAAVLPGSVDTASAAPPRTKLRPEDVARTVVDLLAYPECHSVIEIPPTLTAAMYRELKADS